MRELLDKRLVVVTGKGGVGKTTVAAALGLKAAAEGKRAIVCEVAEQERLAPLFGDKADGYRERELEAGLFGISIDPERAKKEWLEYQLRSGTLAGLLGGSRIFQYLTAAAPGLAELVTIGKVWELAQLERKTRGGAPYDLVIVDAPATGHGIALLRAPQTFSEVARVGPIHRQAGIIHGFLSDPESTGILTVALPEEMPVNETLDLGERPAGRDRHRDRPDRGEPGAARALHGGRGRAPRGGRRLARPSGPRSTEHRRVARAAVAAAAAEAGSRGAGLDAPVPVHRRLRPRAARHAGREAVKP